MADNPVPEGSGVSTGARPSTPGVERLATDLMSGLAQLRNAYIERTRFDGPGHPREDETALLLGMSEALILRARTVLYGSTSEDASS